LQIQSISASGVAWKRTIDKNLLSSDSEDFKLEMDLYSAYLLSISAFRLSYPLCNLLLLSLGRQKTAFNEKKNNPH
jgi:hypothetical protein